MLIKQPVHLTTAIGLTFTARPLQPHDAPMLGQYFTSLSDETRHRFGPHALDQTTANDLCTTINLAEVIRFVAIADDRIIAYFILQLGITPYEATRYAAIHLPLSPSTDATLAPSVADAFQGQGVGSPMLRYVLQAAQQVGRKRVVLLGGTQVTNGRAIHFYEKHGFRKVNQFEYPVGVFNDDMILELRPEQRL